MTIPMIASLALCVAAAVNLYVAFGNWRNAKRNSVLAAENLANAERNVRAAESRLAELVALSEGNADHA